MRLDWCGLPQIHPVLLFGWMSVITVIAGFLFLSLLLAIIEFGFSAFASYYSFQWMTLLFSLVVFLLRLIKYFLVLFEIMTVMTNNTHEEIKHKERKNWKNWRKGTKRSFLRKKNVVMKTALYRTVYRLTLPPKIGKLFDQTGLSWLAFSFSIHCFAEFQSITTQALANWIEMQRIRDKPNECMASDEKHRNT